MHDHPHEAARRQQGIDSLECPFVDALGEYTRTDTRKTCGAGLKKHVREFMPSSALKRSKRIELGSLPRWMR